MATCYVPCHFGLVDYFSLDGFSGGHFREVSDEYSDVAVSIVKQYLNNPSIHVEYKFACDGWECCENEKRIILCKDGGSFYSKEMAIKYRLFSEEDFANMSVLFEQEVAKRVREMLVFAI